MSDWPHAPLHRFNEKGTYIVTAGTYQKQHYFKASESLDFLQSSLIQLSSKYQWKLLAWAIFSNHYHFIVHSETNSFNLKNLIAEYHTKTSSYINDVDSQPGRKIWYQYWDTHLSHQYSYMARLNYVMNNPVKHGLVELASNYPWCSASWFEKNNSAAFVKAVKSFKTDKVNVFDDF